MKSQIILQNNEVLFLEKDSGGYLIVEAIIAVSIVTMMMVSAVSILISDSKLKVVTQSKLDELSNASMDIENGPFTQTVISEQRYIHELGKSTCSLNSNQYSFTASTTFLTGINLPSGSNVTDVIARNNIAYMTVDSANQSDPDFYIIDTDDVHKPFVLSAVNTGPGLASVTVAGHYAYVANESTVSQLEVIDIIDRTKPVIVSKLKLPLPTATTTPPHASSIYYDNGLILLGTEKWNGNELNTIDVHNPLSPQYLGGFDATTRINNIYANTYSDSYVYSADADLNQLRVIDNSIPVRPVLLSGFSPAGSAVLEGKVITAEDSSSTKFYFGRNGGGFDNPNQDELFVFDSKQDQLMANPLHSLNIPGGIYGIVVCGGYVFLAVGSSGNTSPTPSLQVWKNDFSKKVYQIPLPTRPASLSCDHDRLYIGLIGASGGQNIAIVTPYIYTL